MKKLTSKELAAVARKFKSEYVETQIKRKEKFFEENKENISDLIKEIENNSSGIINYILNQIRIKDHINNYFMKYNNVEFDTYISERDIEDFIILSQIEAKDLNDLFALLKERFTPCAN